MFNQNYFILRKCKINLYNDMNNLHLLYDSLYCSLFIKLVLQLYFDYYLKNHPQKCHFLAKCTYITVIKK